jgi:hypothetical protein
MTNKVTPARPKSEGSSFAWPPKANRLITPQISERSEGSYHNDPTGQMTTERFNNLVCNRCDDKLAIYHCDDCSKYFCDICTEELHGEGPWQNHAVNMF